MSGAGGSTLGHNAARSDREMRAGVNPCMSILGNILIGLDSFVKRLSGRERLI